MGSIKFKHTARATPNPKFKNPKTDSKEWHEQALNPLLTDKIASIHQMLQGLKKIMGIMMSRRKIDPIELNAYFALQL